MKKNYFLLFALIVSISIANAQTTFTNNTSATLDGTNCGVYNNCNNDGCSNTDVTVDDIDINISGASSSASVTQICFELDGTDGQSVFDLTRVALITPDGDVIDLFLGNCIGGVGLGVGCFFTDYVGELCFEAGATAQPVTTAGTYETDGTDGFSFTDIAGATVNGDWSIVVIGNECFNSLPPVTFVSFSITIDETLSAEENLLSETLVYPNPAKDNITIESSEELTSIELFSILGNRVFKGVNQRNIDISSFEPGIYLLKLTNESGTITKRILKQ